MLYVALVASRVLRPSRHPFPVRYFLLSPAPDGLSKWRIGSSATAVRFALSSVASATYAHATGTATTTPWLLTAASTSFSPSVIGMWATNEERGMQQNREEAINHDSRWNFLPTLKATTACKTAQAAQLPLQRILHHQCTKGMHLVEAKLGLGRLPRGTLRVQNGSQLVPSPAELCSLGSGVPLGQHRCPHCHGGHRGGAARRCRWTV